MKEVSDYSSIRIKLASPDLIKSWSYGEVKKAETMNYRNLRPERDGLFCERIFGTTKEWECYCGKFKTIRYKGVKCERCGVEVTSAKVRRERMGHINLAAPVSHIWFYRTNPSRISMLLGITKNDLHSVLYYQNYIVLDPGDTDLRKCQILTESDYSDFQSRFGEGSFRADMGAEAIRELLEKINLDDLAKEIRDEIQRTKKEYKSDSNKRKQILRRLEIVENLKSGGNRPEWMILTVLPVIPPDLRPMLEMEGGRYGSTDINDLYRRVINRSNRLKRLIDMIAPDIILKNEKRMLQEAVDNLIDNNANKRTVKGPGNRPLKSLSDILKGKQGRFRLNLLGKRVDFSGRSVIVVGPELRMHQCGLPSVMALELFKPFLYKKLVQDEMIGNMKKARSMVDEGDSKVWEYLDEVVREHPVLLNRAPTLHRLSIQAFEPVLVSGKTIKLHPLVCHAYNADFDGDQMSVHVPLTIAAQIECWTMLLSTRNLLDPANGKPIAFPSQDMVLGIYYLTKALPEDLDANGEKKKRKYYDNVAEVYNAVDNGAVAYQEVIDYRIPETGERVETTPGRVIFNDFLPDGIEFQNKCFGSKQLKELIAETLKTKSNSLTVKLLDLIKDCGFKYATKFGATISMSDIVIPSKKTDVISDASKRESEINGQFRRGVISKEERYNKVIDIWNKANNELSTDLMEELKKENSGFNPLYMMVDSGSRGSKTQISQLGGMRGLMSKPSGEVIDFPIKSNFKEGLSIIEFFISTNGARKGLADTALKTSRAGHLTRRLVDVSQDVVITQEDCGTINGVYKTEYKKDEKVIEPLASRISGCFSLEDVYNPVTNEKIVGVNEEITDEIAQEIEDVGIEGVLVRSVLTCESRKGLCRKCYGRNLANNRPVDIGEAVGVVAAQSIGQPGTQLTMRTFHTGGVAGGDITQGL
ncbi:MAG TPA: DNA-directed RNA polymerase subunit beta', partial [Spirochaetaceae bacterium]|nr:DNA-directed RNA polymerase subunit beta' [Spirochaetaceae bacterium]